MNTNTLLEGRGLRFLAATAVVINGFFPAVWILLTSLKTETELVSKPDSGVVMVVHKRAK